MILAPRKSFDILALYKSDYYYSSEAPTAPRHCSFDVRPHRQVCMVDVNVEITDGPRRGDWDANDRYRNSW